MTTMKLSMRPGPGPKERANIISYIQVPSNWNKNVRIKMHRPQIVKRNLQIADFFFCCLLQTKLTLGVPMYAVGQGVIRSRMTLRFLCSALFFCILSLITYFIIFT